MQKLRIESGNRLCAAFRTKLGIAPSTKEETDDDAVEVLEALRAEFRKITDGVKKELPDKRHFKGTSIISDYSELCLVHQYMVLERDETAHFRKLEKIIEDHPLWITFLEGVRGCGPAMAGVILGSIDITRATYPSSLWQYAGYGVEADGRGTSRKKEHLREVEYIDKEGNQAKRVGIRYNPWLKTKMYVLATCMIKLGGKYREIYDGYKNRLENHTNWLDKSKGHRHNAAMRYMIKRFLCDLYKAWRPLENLPVAPEYSEAKLNMKHGEVKRAA